MEVSALNGNLSTLAIGVHRSFALNQSLAIFETLIQVLFQRRNVLETPPLDHNILITLPHAMPVDLLARRSLCRTCAPPTYSLSSVKLEQAGERSVYAVGAQIRKPYYRAVDWLLGPRLL